VRCSTNGCARASVSGAIRRAGRFVELTRDANGAWSVLAYPQRPSAYGPELWSEQMARNPRSHRNATLRPLRRWDNGRDVIVAGDAAGVVAPASGEGIYYAMECGRLAAEAADRFLVTGGALALRTARQRFMRAHGRVFLILRMMQKFWYSSDKRRESFVSIFSDPDVQRLTWEAYMSKQPVRANSAAHVRIFFKDLGHSLGVVSVWR
jgi:flavin-dependent dehydrogenase